MSLVVLPFKSEDPTLVATNLGVALSDVGHRVCLVDLDVNSGDVAIMLQLNPTRTINDLVAFGGQIDAESLATILTAFAIWNAAKAWLCDPRSLIQGHAIWHVLCAVSAYYLYRYYASEATREPVRRSPPTAVTMSA